MLADQRRLTSDTKLWTHERGKLETQLILWILDGRLGVDDERPQLGRSPVVQLHPGFFFVLHLLRLHRPLFIALALFPAGFPVSGYLSQSDASMLHTRLSDGMHRAKVNPLIVKKLKTWIKLVLGCIETKFASKYQILVGKLSPRSTPCTPLHRFWNPQSKNGEKRTWPKQPRTFCRNVVRFCRNLPKFSQN